MLLQVLATHEPYFMPSQSCSPFPLVTSQTLIFEAHAPEAARYRERSKVQIQVYIPFGFETRLTLSKAESAKNRLFGMNAIFLLVTFFGTILSSSGNTAVFDEDGFYESRTNCDYKSCGANDYVAIPIDAGMCINHDVTSIGCAKKSSTVFTSNLKCPKVYATFVVSSPPYEKGRKNLCVALAAVGSFALPKSIKCPKGFVSGIDKSNMENHACIRDQRIEQKISNGCNSVGPRKEYADDKTLEMQNVRCTGDNLTYEFPALCPKGTPLSQCISEAVNSANQQKLESRRAAQ